MTAASGEQEPEPQEPEPQEPGEQGPGEPNAQQPGGQGPEGQGALAQQRREFLVHTSLEEARRSLELRLWSDAARIAGEVLELDPTNDQARQILVEAQNMLGVGGVQAKFEDMVRRSQIALQKTLFDARQEMVVGDASLDLGEIRAAIEHYERGLLLLRYSPYRPADTELQDLLETKLEAARQAQAEALEREADARRAQSRAELEAREREERIQRTARVRRLMEEANLAFQVGEYERAVYLLDQALLAEPDNLEAHKLRLLANRARHQNHLELIRGQWVSEWARTFDDLNSLDVPQTDPIVITDMAQWARANARGPKQLIRGEDIETPEERAIRERLATTVIEHRFSSATVQDWADYYSRVTEVTFVVTPEVRALDMEATTLTDFQLPPMPVSQALEVIGNVTGVRWKIEHGVVKLVTPEMAGGRTYLVAYEVRDITQGVQSQPGPELKLSVGDQFAAPLLLPEEVEPMPAVVGTGRLRDLIRNYIEPQSWDASGASISEQRGVLLIRQTRAVHERIERLLADLRQAVGIQVDVETRFLQVADNFLEDIGVDFRGLGDQSSGGLTGRGLEENNRQNAGFDDFGQRSLINPATPGEIGTGTQPGVFYDDGQDGDLMARTENLFDSALGGNGGLDNSGGLSLQYVYLDDIELELVLRAVAKQERSEIITAPRLLIYNNTRASVQVLRHTSYISDFSVEIAQAAAVANPVVDVIKDGVVLDVRPVVSADRRFITMELRPTVMTLELPIPNFTTTLGVGQPVSIQLPSVTLQRVRTTVTIPDGGTLMLGGMKLAQKQNLVSGVPLLMDLPILSFFFSRKATSITHRKTLILIRARVVIPEEHVPDVRPDVYPERATMLRRPL